MLARFERLMEQAVEGSLQRVFGAPLQPIQLAKAGARAMEQSQIVGRRGAEVPNLYELHLAAADLSRFGAYAPQLADEVRAYLNEYARERQLRPVAELRAALVQDASVRAGSVRAVARFDGLSRDEQQLVSSAMEGTRRLRLADLAVARAGSDRRGVQRTLRLTNRAAAIDSTIDAEAEVVRLGRASDNDVVVPSQRVSRYHAHLRWVESSWLVYDLESTNGTWLDEQRLQPGEPHLVPAGSRLRLGDFELSADSP